MVLRRVGRRFVDVLVNGTQVDSFEQTGERADYDVSVSDTAETVVPAIPVQKSANDFEEMQIVSAGFLDGQTRQSFEEGYTVDRVKTTCQTKNGGNSRILIEDADRNTVFDNISDGVHDSGWVSRPAVGWGKITATNRSGGFTQLRTVTEIEVTVSSGFSVDGATQS